MAKVTYKTPGVYIQEKNAFPNSVVGVPTAIPAFIGYTYPVGKSRNPVHNKALKISSFTEFLRYFPVPGNAQIKPYRPQYFLVEQNQMPASGPGIQIGTNYYALVPDPASVYYLYNSIRWFYQNGGGDAYIVSVGSYDATFGNPLPPGSPLINPHISLNDLLNGLKVLREEAEPTMYVCPDATLLPPDQQATLMQAMLAQNAELKTAISLFDVPGGRKPDPTQFMSDITDFRSMLGTENLSFGAAYYPFVKTNVMDSGEIDFTNLFDGRLSSLVAFLEDHKAEPDVSSLLTTIQSLTKKGASTLTKDQLHRSLITASPFYKKLMRLVMDEANLLPPSGAMAGIISRTDNMEGVWKAPANTSVMGATGLPIQLTNDQQSGLNIDPHTGKSINAIRSFPGQGILVWGARTLVGNDNEWRYIPVRRTAIYIEQSCKLAAKAYVFEANDANTWTAIRNMLENFLSELWREGALAGASEKQSYFVKCGLDTTMTQQDIQQGRLIVEIGFAPVRPAEFVMLRFEQKMQ
jgi:uncharacterized protein